jgi:Family of unknown function (DUF6624)
MRKLFFLLLLPTLLSAHVADELIEMGRKSQDQRLQLIAREWARQAPEEGLRAIIHDHDIETTERLKEIVAESGWPRKAAVGEQAAKAAWLIAQHSQHDPDFMDQVLRLITPLVATGEIKPDCLAQLTDQIAVARGEPQLYGTQYTTEWISGALQLTPTTPIFEERHLAHRREALGLDTHTEYLQKLAAIITGAQG